VIPYDKRGEDFSDMEGPFLCSQVIKSLFGLENPAQTAE